MRRETLSLARLCLSADRGPRTPARRHSRMHCKTCVDRNPSPTSIPRRCGRLKERLVSNRNPLFRPQTELRSNHVVEFLAAALAAIIGALMSGCAGDPMPPSRSPRDPANPAAPEAPMGMPALTPTTAAGAPTSTIAAAAPTAAHEGHDHSAGADAGMPLVPQKP